MRPNKELQPAFTLMEVTLSASVAAVVMGGIASAVVIAGRAMPSADSGLQRTVAAYAIAEQIASELYCAKSFNERTDTSIEFTVADRDNDATPETVRYDWSDTASDPLLRTYNATPAATLLEAVTDFRLTYDLQSLTESQTGPAVDHPDWPIVSLPGITPIPASGYPVGAASWCGMYFELNPATAPPDPKSWTVDEIRFRIRATSGLETIHDTAVQLRAADGSKLPSATIYDQTIVPGLGLDNTTWTEIRWTGIASPRLDANEGICVVFTAGILAVAPAAILYQNTTGISAADFTSFLRTADGGSAWTSSADEALTECYIFGTVTTQSPVETTRYFLASVGMELQPGSQASTRVATSVEVLNNVETTGP